MKKKNEIKTIRALLEPYREESRQGLDEQIKQILVKIDQYSKTELTYLRKELVKTIVDDRRFVQKNISGLLMGFELYRAPSLDLFEQEELIEQSCCDQDVGRPRFFGHRIDEESAHKIEMFKKFTKTKNNADKIKKKEQKRDYREQIKSIR